MISSPLVNHRRLQCGNANPGFKSDYALHQTATTHPEKYTVYYNYALKFLRIFSRATDHIFSVIRQTHGK